MGGVFSRSEHFLSEPKFTLDAFWSYIKYFLFSEPDSPEDFLTDDLLEVLFEDDGSHYETQQMGGHVTKLRESQSLAIIDKEIYMDLAVPVPGGKKLRLGDYVLAIVKRRCPEDAWRVQRVEVVDRGNTWKSKDEFDDCSMVVASCLTAEDGNQEDHLKTKTIVGQITKIENGKVIHIDHGKVKFEVNAEFNFVVGDLVATKVQFDPEEPDRQLQCVTTQPLRKWKFEGRINVLEGDAGVIDNDVYFDTNVCLNG